MLYQKEQNLVFGKVERTFLDAIQAGGCNNKSSRNVWDRALDQYQIYISMIYIRQSHFNPEDADREESFSENDVYLPPSAAPDCEYSESKRGFRIYMDQKMYDSCCDDQMIIACLFLMVSKTDKKLFDKMNKFSSMHELYEVYPEFHSTVDTIRQALKACSAF